jgi:hypothetical protein
VSHDKGKHWIHTDRMNLNALSFGGRDGWAVGAKGTLARFNNKYEYIIRNGGAAARSPGEMLRAGNFTTPKEHPTQANRSLERTTRPGYEF